MEHQIDQKKMNELLAEISALEKEKPFKKCQSESAEEAIEELLQHQKEVFGIDWKKHAANQENGVQNAFADVKNYLTGLVDQFTEEERKKAIEMDLLTREGEIAILRHGTFPALSKEGLSDDKKFLVMGWQKKTAEHYANLTGKKIKTEIINLTHNLGVLSKSDSAVFISRNLLEMGIWGLGVVALAAVAATIAGLLILTYVESLYAIFQGVLAIGVAILTFIIATVVLAILIPLFLMLKDAISYQLLINTTDDDMAMDGNPVFTHGKWVATFKQGPKTSGEDSKQIIPKQIIFKNKEKKVVGSCIFGGFNVARKRDGALFGTQGALKFKPTKLFPSGAYIGWEVPLTNTIVSGGPNRLLVSANYKGSLSGFSDKTDDDGKTTGVSVNEKTRGQIQGRLNSSSGSVGYMICSFQKK